MTTCSIRSTIVVSVLLVASRPASADCVISGVRPTVPLPTMAAGQQFSFIATADCERLRFRVPETTLIKIPKAGPGTGLGDRTYKVALTEREWDSLVDDTDTTFTWSIIGTTSAGVTTRVTTTNEIDLEQGVTLDLSLADAKLVGEDASDYAGSVVSGAGDVDGDGHDDILVGAFGDDGGGSRAGAAFLVLGPVTGTIDFSVADAKLVGEEPDDYAYIVSRAGDVDGEGHDDLLIGAGVNGGNDEGGLSAGAAYLVLGPVTGTLDLSLADAKFVGEEERDFAGASVSNAGDVDGNGNDDLLVGAGGNDEGRFSAGAAYLVLGPTSGTLDLAFADAKLVGEAAQDYAHSVSSAGDADGDGLDDILVGAYRNDEGGQRAGAAYLVLGPVSGTLDLSRAHAKLVGESRRDDAGASVSDAGDVDGDGLDDLLVGARGASDSVGWLSVWPGAAYLVLSPVAGTLDLSLADARLVGEEPYDLAGSVSDAGDVDGDGHDDLLVGANANEEGGPSSGAAYLLLGPVTGTINLSRADAKLVGEGGTSSASAGSSVSGGGDVDGDGLDDLLIGSSAAAYLVLGGSIL